MNIKSQGFSLIELSVAVAIMAILGAIAMVSFNAIRQKARMSAVTATMRTLEQGIESYHDDTGSYPSTLADLSERPADPKISKKWQGPYLKKAVSEDPWGTEYFYQVTKGGKHPYELYSWGKNKEGSPSEEHIDVWNL